MNWCLWGFQLGEQHPGPTEAVTQEDEAGKGSVCEAAALQGQGLQPQLSPRVKPSPRRQPSYGQARPKAVQDPSTAAVLWKTSKSQGEVMGTGRPRGCEGS